MAARIKANKAVLDEEENFAGQTGPAFWPKNKKIQEHLQFCEGIYEEEQGLTPFRTVF